MEPWSLRHVSVRIISVLARTMAGAKNVLASVREGEGSGTRFCWRWTFGAGRRGVNGMGAADGTENGTLEERKGKDVEEAMESESASVFVVLGGAGSSEM